MIVINFAGEFSMQKSDHRSDIFMKFLMKVALSLPPIFVDVKIKICFNFAIGKCIHEASAQCLQSGDH